MKGEGSNLMKAEVTAIGNVAVAIRALLSGTDNLGRGSAGSQKRLEAAKTNTEEEEALKPNTGNCSPPPFAAIMNDEPSDTR